MKKILFTLLAVISISIASFSQDLSTTAVTDGKVELAKSKVSNVYVYHLPENITHEHIERVSNYYKSYFSIGFDNDTKEAILTLIPEAKGATMVMARFLSSCGIQDVKVDKETLKLDKFISAYLK